MSLVESPTLTTQTIPLKSATLPSQAYVLSLASLPFHYAASASAPSNAIHIFDKSDLRIVCSLPGHDVATSSLRSVDAIAGMTHQVLVSSGKDGTVKAWDERSGAVAIESQLQSFKIMRSWSF